MEELIKNVSERAGINPEQARSAVNAVLDFVKAKMPGLGEQITGMLTGGGGGGVIDDVRKKFGF